jgi:hypothetical protein
LRRSEFGFIDFRDSPAGWQACLQGSTLTVWEVMLLVQSYKKDVSVRSETSPVTRSESPGSGQFMRGHFPMRSMRQRLRMRRQILKR